MILATGYMHDRVNNFVSDARLDLKVSYESHPIGTLGAIFNALPMVNNDHILVLNGDTIFDFNFNLMFTKYLAAKRPLLLLKPRTNHFTYPGYIINGDYSLWVNCDSTHFSLGAFFISRPYRYSFTHTIYRL